MKRVKIMTLFYYAQKSKYIERTRRLPMELLEIPLVGDTKESQLPTPEEYTYWKDRKNRTFYVDYEIDECYSLVELAKIIIQMNIEEKDVKKEDLKPIRLFIHSYGGDLEQANFFCVANQRYF